MPDKNDMLRAAQEAGLRAGDTVLVHSSMRSLGSVPGGAAAALADALRTLLTDAGTLVVPTLIQKDFPNAYRDWRIDRPSDVGYFTEYVRTLPGALRSDQATHSVAAIGARAEYITQGHCAFGPRPGVFGSYAFSHSSPWQKMYDMGGKVLFVGVDMTVNTYKHFVEYREVEARLDAITDPVKKARALSGVWQHEDYARLAAGGTEKIWPFYPPEPMQKAMDEAGLIRRARCGDAEFLCLDIRPMVDFAYAALEKDVDAWYPPRVAAWLRDPLAQAGDAQAHA